MLPAAMVSWRNRTIRWQQISSFSSKDTWSPRHTLLSDLYQPDQYACKPDGCCQLQWFLGEIEQSDGSKFHHFLQRILGLPGKPCFPLIVYGELLKSHPGDQPAYVFVFLMHVVENINDLAVDKTEITGIYRKWNIQKKVKGPVKDLRCLKLEKVFTFSFFTHAIDYIAIFCVVYFEHFRDHFRGVLQICVNNDRD